MRTLSWSVRCMLVLVLVITVSCSFGDDDDDPVSTPPTATSTEEAQDSPSATSTKPATPSTSPTDSATATATTSPTATPPPTATPSPTATAAVIETPFAETVAPHTVIDNYTLRFEMTTTGDNPDTNAMINYDQQTPTRYHLLSAGSNPNILPLEIWILDDQAFTTLADGTITAVPGNVDANLFQPNEYLSRVPDLSVVDHATRIGREEVNGRLARHYQVDAEDLQSAILRLPANPVAIEGTLDVWVDWEHSFVSQITGTVEWEDAAGAEYSTEINYQISEVGSTPEIQSPA